MCKYCEPINKQANWCKSIVDTGLENAVIVYGCNSTYIGISGRKNAISEPISFCPFCGKSLAPKINSIEPVEPKYKQIDESDIKVGDYICIDGESSFCSFGRHMIDDILTKYDEDTGKKYLVYVDTDGNKWNSKTRYCMNGLNAYCIVGFCRKIN